MSVWYSNDRHVRPDLHLYEHPESRWNDEEFSRIHAEEMAWGCFYCHETLTFPVIQWHGMPCAIYLHAECAIEWQLKLARDCNDYMRAKKRGKIGPDGERL